MSNKRLNLVLMLELVFVVLSFIICSNESASCKYTVSGYTIDLSPLSGKTLSGTENDWTYYFSPCKDGLTCTDSGGTSHTCMADQYKSTNTFCTAYLAVWDDITPTYSNGVFTFKWDNGQTSNTCESGRTFTAKFSCGTSTYTVSSVSSSGCDYTMSISSEYACPTSSGGGGSSSSDDSGSLSFGSIFLIILICGVFLYCVIGYIICAKKNPENGWGNVKANTPHLSFWCLLPKLTWAGCCVSKEWTVNKVNSLRGKGGAGGGESYDKVADGE